MVRQVCMCRDCIVGVRREPARSGREARRRNTAGDGVHYTQTPGQITFFRYHPVPLFPGQEIFFLHVWIGIHGRNLDLLRSGRARLTWRVYADDAVPRMDEVDLADFGVVQRAVSWVEARQGGG